MKWECTSTDSPQEIATRFAKEMFPGQCRKIDRDSFKPLPSSGAATTCMSFKLVGGIKTYEIQGTPPGHWVIVSKADKK